MVFQLHLEDLIVVFLVDMSIQYKEIFEKRDDEVKYEIVKPHN